MHPRKAPFLCSVTKAPHFCLKTSSLNSLLKSTFGSVLLFKYSSMVLRANVSNFIFCSSLSTIIIFSLIKNIYFDGGFHEYYKQLLHPPLSLHKCSRKITNHLIFRTCSITGISIMQYFHLCSPKLF